MPSVETECRNRQPTNPIPSSKQNTSKHGRTETHATSLATPENIFSFLKWWACQHPALAFSTSTAGTQDSSGTFITPPQPQDLKTMRFDSSFFRAQTNISPSCCHLNALQGMHGACVRATNSETHTHQKVNWSLFIYRRNRDRFNDSKQPPWVLHFLFSHSGGACFTTPPRRFLGVPPTKDRTAA